MRKQRKLKAGKKANIAPDIAINAKPATSAPLIEKESKQVQNAPILTENKQEMVKTAPPLKNIDTSELGPTRELTYIKEKRKYLAFKKMIKSANYVSARIAADAIGVNENTIQSWLDTKAIREALIESASLLASELQAMKVPQGHIYLLNRLSPEKKSENTVNTQVNITLPTVESSTNEIINL